MSDFKDLFGEWQPREGMGRGEDLPQLEPENRVKRELREKEVKVLNVWEGVIEAPGMISGEAKTFFVQMRDNHGRELRIYVVKDVALSIAMALDNDTPDRPYTHDLMKTFLDRFNAKIERVIIDDLWQDTFYSKIYITHGNDIIEIDARPSDAIAMALRGRAPIYVAEDVLEQAALER